MLAAAALVAACEPKPAQQADPAASAAASTPLYDRLGGAAAIATVDDAFVANVAGDTAAMRQFKQKLVDQICAGTGGPCTYTGLDMKAAHQGMGITDADFDSLAEDLVTALDSVGVPQTEKDELLAILGPMRADMVMM